MMYLIPAASSFLKFKAGNSTIELPKNIIGYIGSYRKYSLLPIREGYSWAADNDAFTQGFQEKKFFDWLQKVKKYQSTCLFVVVPDVLCNPVATLSSWRTWAWRIKALGYPVAFVAQDGQESLPFPPEFDWLFIGGSTDWKLGRGAKRCIRYAQERGRKVHIGRVNSNKRYNRFKFLGCDSCDGTNVAYKPKRVLSYIALNRQGILL